MNIDLKLKIVKSHDLIMIIFFQISSDEEGYETESSYDENDTRDIAEHWDNTELHELAKDLCSKESNQKANDRERNKSKARALFEWVTYFLLVLQLRQYLSDQTLEYILQFLVGISKIIGTESFIAMSLSSLLPSSIYLLRTRIGLDRGEFSKYAVCIKCK